MYKNSVGTAFYRQSVAKTAAGRYTGGRANKREVVLMEHGIDNARFGAFVAALRKEKGWTQKQLAEQIGVSDKAVSKWERGVSQS